MPWRETAPMAERMRFVTDWERSLYSMTELCQRYGVSRKTGYKWIARYEEDGPDGLRERSRAPHHCPHRIAPEVAALICGARRQHPSWGPAKLVAWLRPRPPSRHWPAVSTAGDLLGAARAGEETAAPAPLPAPRRRSRDHHPAQRSVDRRLQGPLPYARRDVLLPADDCGPAHTLSSRVSRPALHQRPRRAPGLRSAVSRIRAAAGDSPRQWGALRPDRDARPLPAHRVVVAPRHSAPADSSGVAAAERRA